jgi:hypothetical protein
MGVKRLQNKSSARGYARVPQKTTVERKRAALRGGTNGVRWLGAPHLRARPPHGAHRARHPECKERTRGFGAGVDVASADADASAEPSAGPDGSEPRPRTMTAARLRGGWGERDPPRPPSKRALPYGPLLRPARRDLTQRVLSDVQLTNMRRVAHWGYSTSVHAHCAALTTAWMNPPSWQLVACPVSNRSGGSPTKIRRTPPRDWGAITLEPQPVRFERKGGWITVQVLVPPPLFPDH